MRRPRPCPRRPRRSGGAAQGGEARPHAVGAHDRGGGHDAAGRPGRMGLLPGPRRRTHVHGGEPAAPPVGSGWAPAGHRRLPDDAGAGGVRDSQEGAAISRCREHPDVARGPHLQRHRRAGPGHVSHLVQVQRHRVGGLLVDGDRGAVGVRRPLPLYAYPAEYSRPGVDQGRARCARRGALGADRRAGAARADAGRHRGVRASRAPPDAPSYSPCSSASGACVASWRGLRATASAAPPPRRRALADRRARHPPPADRRT